MNRAWWVLGLCMMTIGAMPAAGWAATPPEGAEGPDARAGRWVATSGVAVDEGDYGTSDSTTIAQISQTVKYQGQAGEVGVMIPYVFRRGTTATPGEGRRTSTQAISSDAEGLGDVRLTGKQYWIPETESHPSVDLTAMVKFPTADEDKALGTGRVDAGVGAELMKQFGALFLFGEAGIVGRDRPSGSTLKPVRADYAVGVGYAMTERFTPSVSLEGSTKVSDGTEAPLAMVVSGAYKVAERTRVNGYVLAGLSDGSPDVGAGASVTWLF